MLYSLFKKILFSFDPESIHNILKTSSPFFPKHILHTACRFSHPALKTTLGETTLENPLGLAAGFDKDGDFAPLLWALGFGFAELGTVTYRACDGNPRPRIFRLPLDSSLINRMGLPNHGVSNLLNKISNRPPPLPVGINIAKTPGLAHTITEAIDDIIASLKLLQGQGAYTVINLSCPNTKDPKIFEHKENLESLLKEVILVSQSHSVGPLLLKLSPDLEIDTLRSTIDLAVKHDIDGFILSNTTLKRPHLRTPETVVNTIGRGGLSGAALKILADNQLKEVFEIVGQDKILVASGGIMSFEDLCDKIRFGASLYEIYSGLIYNGPVFVKHLKRQLAALCEKLGVKNYQELIGQDFSANLSA